jgi:hypothetical protein
MPSSVLLLLGRLSGSDINAARHLISLGIKDQAEIDSQLHC